MIQLHRPVLAVLVLVTATATAACTAVDSLGEVAVPLSTTTPDGTIYRLRDGNFQIVDSGGLGLGLSTESEPGATALHADLEADQYSVELLGGWRMERSAGGAPFEPVAATLSSTNPQSFQVVDGATVQIAYAFRVDGVGDVALGGGVDIGIDVYTACDPVAQTGCAAGERCTRVGLSGGGAITTCAPEGTVPEGGTCWAPAVGADDCVAGTLCVEGRCAATCASGASSCSCDTGAFSDVPTAGVCSQGCDLLAQDCANPTDACYYIGGGATCAAPTPDAGAPGEPCSFVNQCVEGSVCSTLGSPTPDQNACTLLCAASGASFACADVLGASFTCIDLALPEHPDVGLCVDCNVYPSYCAP
jgi:hypothetical protein